MALGGGCGSGSNFFPDPLPPFAGIRRWNRWVRDMGLRTAQTLEQRNATARGQREHFAARWDAGVSLAPGVTPQAFMLPRR